MPAIKKNQTATASFVRKLISASNHTTSSAADEIGISKRTMRRYVSYGKDFQQPPMVVLVALRSLRVKRGPRRVSSPRG